MMDGLLEEETRLVEQALHTAFTYEGKDLATWVQTAGFLATEVIRLRQQNERYANLLAKHDLLPSDTMGDEGVFV